MSSDESDMESGDVVYLIKHCPWRNPFLAPWLRVFDSIHLHNRGGEQGRSDRGARPRKRNPSGLVSDRLAPKGLPRDAYNEVWLSRLPEWTHEDYVEQAAPVYGQFVHDPVTLQ